MDKDPGDPLLSKIWPIALIIGIALMGLGTSGPPGL